MINRPDAGALLDGTLGDWLGEQGSRRASARVKSWQLMGCGVVFALLVAGTWLALGGGIGDAIVWGGGFLLVGGFLAHGARRTVTDSIKGKVNAAIAEALGIRFSLEVTDAEPFRRVQAFGLVPEGHDTLLEDEWSGEVAGTAFRLHEAKLTRERSFGVFSITQTVFRGVVLSLVFARSFCGVTLIERAGLHGGVGGSDRIRLNGIDLARIDMVHPEFADAFAVWSDDGVEARYLVHPGYIERLVAVEQAWSGHDIRALFSGGELLVVLETANLFESGSLHARLDRQLLETAIAQFSSLAELVTKLNERRRD